MDLKFQFDSLQAFMDMGGHGPYVWACYGLTFAAVLFLIVEPRIQKKRFIKQQRVLAKRKANMSDEVENASA